MPDTVVPDSPPSPADLHTAADCPVAVRQVAAQVLNGTRYYGGAAGHAVPLPDSVVQIAADPGTDCPTWRIDANAAVPQPDGHGKRFQEQDTFDPDCALEVALDVRPAPHGPMLCLYQHKEWWMRPAWCSNPADIPSRTQLVLWRSDERGDLPAAAKTDAPTGVVLAGGKPQQDTDEPAPVATWTAVMAFSGDDIRADLHGDIGPESDGQKSVDGGTSGGNLPSGGNVVGSSVAGIIDPSTISGRFRLNVASSDLPHAAPASTRHMTLRHAPQPQGIQPQQHAPVEPAKLATGRGASSVIGWTTNHRPHGSPPHPKHENRKGPLILSRFDDYSDRVPIADKLPHDLTTI